MRSAHLTLPPLQIDQGGVKKEFFQMVIREMFDPSKGYGASACSRPRRPASSTICAPRVRQTCSRTFPTHVSSGSTRTPRPPWWSLSSSALCVARLGAARRGVVAWLSSSRRLSCIAAQTLGLAIYNSVILDVHFPTVQRAGSRSRTADPRGRTGHLQEAGLSGLSPDADRLQRGVPGAWQARAQCLPRAVCLLSGVVRAGAGQGPRADACLPRRR